MGGKACENHGRRGAESFALVVSYTRHSRGEPQHANFGCNKDIFLLDRDWLDADSASASRSIVSTDLKGGGHVLSAACALFIDLRKFSDEGL
jgi:hypothetical protein